MDWNERRRPGDAAAQPINANDSSRKHQQKFAPALLAIVTALAGCSVAGPRQSPLIDATAGSPTVSDIYSGRITPGTDEPARPDTRALLHSLGGAQPIGPGDELTNRYWSALEPMNQRFQRVPNPDLVMVVYPHLAKGKYPVPGYVTVFPMYDEVHYALPGEVETELATARRLNRPDGQQ